MNTCPFNDQNCTECKCTFSVCGTFGCFKIIEVGELHCSECYGKFKTCGKCQIGLLFENICYSCDFELSAKIGELVKNKLLAQDKLLARVARDDEFLLFN
jgi:hypothetical protein